MVRVYIKVGMILLVALLLLVPLGMIASVVDDRSHYRDQVIREIERTWSGEQIVTGPVLKLPYLVDLTERITNPATGKLESRVRREHRMHYLIAETLHLESTAQTEMRTIGIYSVPVYTSHHDMRATFAFSSLETIENTEHFVRWGSPTLSLMVSDGRGISGEPVLNWNGQTQSLQAGSEMPNNPPGLHANVIWPQQAQTVDVSMTLTLRGSQSLYFSPLAHHFNASLQSGWPHPKFDGQFLPASRTVSDEGFSGVWDVSSFATNAQTQINGCFRESRCAAHQLPRLGVTFFEPVDIYTKVTRAIKYGVLFIAITFVAFFLTETLTRARLHPMQYVLVGLSLAIFYLLLVSLSEHMPFRHAYVMATVSSVTLIGVYLSGALGHRRLAFLYSVGMGLLYAMLFTILRSEDFALLMGTILLFGLLAAVMLLTRRIDWYEFGRGKRGATTPDSDVRLPGH
ncbi:MAG: cell envelope integrity protein CreD [Pseudomonadota bacterium]